MSLAFAVVDNAMVVPDVEPNTLLVVDGNVIVLPPVASCVTTRVPYEPAAGVEVKLNVLFPANVTLAFKPSVGFQLILVPSVNTCGVDA